MNPISDDPTSSLLRFTDCPSLRPGDKIIIKSGKEVLSKYKIFSIRKTSEQASFTNMNDEGLVVSLYNYNTDNMYHEIKPYKIKNLVTYDKTIFQPILFRTVFDAIPLPKVLSLYIREIPNKNQFAIIFEIRSKERGSVSETVFSESAITFSGLKSSINENSEQLEQILDTEYNRIETCVDAAEYNMYEFFDISTDASYTQKKEQKLNEKAKSAHDLIEEKNSVFI